MAQSKQTKAPVEPNIKWTEVTSDRISVAQYYTKPIPTKPNEQSKGTYSDVILNYLSGEKRLPKEFLFEGPEMVSNSGPKMFKDENKQYPDWSLLARVDKTKPTEKAFIDFFTNVIYKHCCALMNVLTKPNPNNMNQTAIGGFDTVDWEKPSKAFVNVVRPATDKNKVIIQGKPDKFAMKLVTYGQGKTLFTDLKKNPIAWADLVGKTIKFIPLIHVEKIYCGAASCSLQIKLRSALVTDVDEPNGTTTQDDTIDEYLAANPEAAERLEKKLAELKLKAANKALDTDHTKQVVTEGKKEDDSQPTFSGIGSTTGPTLTPLLTTAPIKIVTSLPPPNT